jgi:hypothetical protein
MLDSQDFGRVAVDGGRVIGAAWGRQFGDVTGGRNPEIREVFLAVRKEYKDRGGSFSISSSVAPRKTRQFNKWSQG